MLVKTFGSAVYGVEAITITVEVNWMSSGVNYTIVGLPDNAVKESMQRVESTIKSIQYDLPRTKIVVNLAPAYKKERHCLRLTHCCWDPCRHKSNQKSRSYRAVPHHGRVEP